MTNHPPLGMVDVYVATIPSVAFTPALHVNYAETVLPIRDGLPKLKDFPAEMGGSGTVLPNTEHRGHRWRYQEQDRLYPQLILQAPVLGTNHVDVIEW